MTYRGDAGGGYAGHHLTVAALEALRPAADNAGRMATVGTPGIAATYYISQGGGWVPIAALATDPLTGKATLLTSPDGTIDLVKQPANTVVLFGDSLTAYNWARVQLTSLTGVAGGYVATANFTAHKLKVGDPFKLSNAGDNAYNGNFVVATVPNANSFTYLTTTPITSSTDASATIWLHYPAQLSNAGYWSWADILMGGRFSLLNNAGQTGEKLAAMLARINTDVIAFKPARVVFLGGTNDIRTGTADPVAMFALWTQIIGILRANGIIVTCLTVPTFGATEAQNTPAKIAAIMEFNRRIREAVRTTSGLELADSSAALADPTATDGSSTTANFEDLIHFSPRGAYLVGKAIAAAMSGFAKPVNSLPSNPSDGYTFASGGKQLLDNPLFQAGAGGTVSAPVTGAAPVNWRAEGSGSGVYVASVVARTAALDGDTYGYNAKIVSTFAASNDSVQVRQNSLTARVAAGDYIYGECSIRVVNMPTTLKRLNLTVNITVDGVAYSAVNGLGSSSNTMLIDDLAAGAVFRTPPIKVPSDAVSITACEIVAFMQTSGASGAGVEFHVGRAALRKI